MRHALRTSLIGLLLVGAVLVTACGSSGEEVESGADASTSTTGGDSSPGATGSGDTVAPVPGTSDTTQTTWARIEPTDDLVGTAVVTPTELLVDPEDDTVVLVRFYGGVQDCYGANVSIVREDDSVVEVRLETGTRPEATDQACIEIAEAQELAVTLDAPLGDRRLSASSAG